MMGVILAPRDLSGSVRDLREDFSSFDRCMQRNLCKIPFIVICVIGGLIVLSLIMCCVRCVLCGYACCSCCCGGCCGSRSRGSRRRRRSEKHSRNDSPQTFIQPQPVVIQQPIIHQAPAVVEPPQYAYFNSNGDDALPPMPSLQNERVRMESHEMTDVTQQKASNPYDMHPTPAISSVASPEPSSHYEYGQLHHEPSFHQPRPPYHSDLGHPHLEAPERMYGNEYVPYHHSEPQYGPDSHYGYGQKKPELWAPV